MVFFVNFIIDSVQNFICIHILASRVALPPSDLNFTLLLVDACYEHTNSNETLVLCSKDALIYCTAGLHCLNHSLADLNKLQFSINDQLHNYHNITNLMEQKDMINDDQALLNHDLVEPKCTYYIDHTFNSS